MAKRNFVFLSLLLALVLLSTVGCQPSTRTPNTGKKSIVVTYSILGSIVKDLVGDKANVTVSIPNGLDPHEWEPSAKDIETAAAYGVKHFLFTSTHRVYGRPSYLPVDEKHPLNPEESGRTLYAIFRLANEKLCLSYWREHGLPVTIFRFWWSFGDEIGGKALRMLIDTALKGQPIRVPQEAGGSFLHNDDATRAFYLAMLNDKAYGEVFNLSSGAFTTWRELAELVCELTNSSSRLELVPREKWQGDVSVGTDQSIPYICDLDISKAELLLGYRPKYSTQDIASLLRKAVSRLVLARKKG